MTCPAVRSIGFTPLIETPHFARAAAQTGTISHLWGGEHVRVTTPEPGALHLDATHPELAELVRQHITNAAQDLQQLFSPQDEPEEEAPDLDVLGGLAEPVRGGLMSLSREERLDRARALRGQSVMDTHDVRAAEDTQRMQEHALLVFPPSEDVEVDPPLSDEEVADLARREQLLLAEGESGFYDANDSA